MIYSLTAHKYIITSPAHIPAGSLVTFTLTADILQLVVGSLTIRAMRFRLKLMKPTLVSENLPKTCSATTDGVRYPAKKQPPRLNVEAQMLRRCSSNSRLHVTDQITTDNLET